MDCREFENLISGYLDGELTGPQEEQFLAHKAGCSKCAEALEEFSALDRMMAESGEILPDEDYWPGFDARLNDKITKATRKKPWWSFLTSFRKSTLGWAAVTLLILFALVTPALREVMYQGHTAGTPLPAVTRRAKVKSPAKPDPRRNLAEPAQDKELMEKKKLSLEDVTTGKVSKQPADECPSAVETEGDALMTKPGKAPKRSDVRSRTGTGEDLHRRDVYKTGEVKEESADTDDAPSPTKKDVKSHTTFKAGEITCPTPIVASLPKPSDVPEGPRHPENGKKFKNGPVEISGNNKNRDRNNKDETSTGKVYTDASGVRVLEIKRLSVPKLKPGMAKEKATEAEPMESAKGAKAGVKEPCDFTGDVFNEASSSPEGRSYLSRSEVVLIKMVNLKDDPKDLRMLQNTLKRSSFDSIIEKDNRLFKEDPRLGCHARLMRKFSTELMKINPEKIDQFKEEVLKSGILEKTRELKI